MTSKFAAVNLPVFHITPMNLALPASPVPTIPVGNSTLLPSVAHANPIQAPSSSVRNCTLQDLGLMPASMQMSADPGLGSGPIHRRAECVSSVSKSKHLKQGQTLEHNRELNGSQVLTIPLQRVRGFLCWYLLS